jgi:hypothetical protein
VSLLTGLVSYWKLDEASGDALDAHASNDGADVNTVGSGTGKIGNARSFNGSDQRFDVTDPGDFTSPSGLSVVGWINGNSTSVTHGFIASKGANWGFLFLWTTAVASRGR